MSSKVNGEHKEKVLMRWDGGETNSDDYDLESDMVSAGYRLNATLVGLTNAASNMYGRMPH